MKTIADIIHKIKFPMEILDYNSKGGDQLYIEYVNGFWWLREFDSSGNQIYFENSNGYIEDKRT